MKSAPDLTVYVDRVPGERNNFRKHALTQIKNKDEKTHLIHRPINICATSPLRLIKRQ
jgi:hypothetical protein